MKKSIVLMVFLMGLIFLSGEALADRVLTINIKSQTFSLNSGGKVVRTGKVSTGKHNSTPRGRFAVLYKERHKKSSKYPKPRGGAPMPYAMQINGNIFMHQGKLPGYPASHGCVRLSRSNAKYLFGTMKVGDRVIVR